MSALRQIADSRYNFYAFNNDRYGGITLFLLDPETKRYVRGHIDPDDLMPPHLAPIYEQIAQRLLEEMGL